MIEYHAKSSNRAVKDDKLLTYDSITTYKYAFSSFKKHHKVFN